MVTVQNAIEIIRKQTFRNPKVALKQLDEVLDFILAQDVYSPINMPPFRQSAMDGYAINIHDVNSYKVIDEVKAGDGHHPVLHPGQAIRIFTGAAVPDTANAVVMQEKTTIIRSCLTVNTEINLEENIRQLGEQVKKDAIALKTGTLMTPAAIGFLASLGIKEVEVYQKPNIAILTTGDELISAGQALGRGKLYESNSMMLKCALEQYGFKKITTHKVEDDFKKTRSLLQELIDTYDVILTTGGVSVGDYDFIEKTLISLDVIPHFYKVKQKPGKPLYFGKKGAVSVFGLPGNPSAALSCLYVYVIPMLHQLSGNTNCELRKTLLKSKSVFHKKGNRAQFLKAISDKDTTTILDGQSSAMLQSFALANSLVYMPAHKYCIKEGDVVEVIKILNSYETHI